MIVCQCAVVSDGDVTAAVGSGCRTLRDVCAATGAGRDCGSCVFAVRRVLTGAAATTSFLPSPLAPEVARATG
jgi:bacterioferritin-associated ferredoxin